jgi:uncharacterized membrane protein (UPF0127 family)
MIGTGARDGSMQLVNTRTGATLATAVEMAVTRTERRRGLLGRNSLAPSGALVLSPCWAIHTAFMRFAIDVVFVDRRGRTVRVVRDLPPWRVAVAPRAQAAIELAAGSLGASDLRIGDELTLQAEPSHEALAG